MDPHALYREYVELCRRRRVPPISEADFLAEVEAKQRAKAAERLAERGQFRCRQCGETYPMAQGRLLSDGTLLRAPEAPPQWWAQPCVCDGCWPAIRAERQRVDDKEDMRRLRADGMAAGQGPLPSQPIGMAQPLPDAYRPAYLDEPQDPAERERLKKRDRAALERILQRMYEDWAP
jgi:hypothetical protein